MALLSYYDIGFASVANGSTAVTGTGTQWAVSVRPGDIFWGPDGANVRIASVEAAGALTLAFPWPGADLVQSDYEVRLTPVASSITASVRELLEKLRQGLWLTPNATGTLAERAGYDSARRGFIYMQTDVDPFVVFVKQTDTAGDWSPGFSPQQGPAGPYTTIEAGTVTTLAPDAPATVSEFAVGDTVTLNFGIPAGRGFYFKGTYSAAVTYNKDDVVFYNGSAFIANVTTQANTPDPTQNTAAWSRMALRGSDGDITGVTPFWASIIQTVTDADVSRAYLDAEREFRFDIDGAPLDSDFNAFVTPGPSRMLMRAAAGGPYVSTAPIVDNYFYVINLVYSTNICQLAFPYVGAQTTSYVRNRISDVWSAWRPLVPPTTNASLLTSGTVDAARLPSKLAEIVANTRPRFTAAKSVQQTSVSNAKVTFPAEAFDIGGHYDAASSRWTPPAGTYKIGARVLIIGGTAGTAFTLALYKNGSIWSANQTRAGSGGYSIFVEDIVESNGTDFWEVYFSSNGASSDILPSYTYSAFYGHEV